MNDMKNKINFIIVLLIGFCLIIGCANSDKQSKDIKTDSIFQKPLQEAITKKIGKLHPKWQEIEFYKFEENAVTINLYYSKMPSGLTETESDTKAIAQAVLDTLIAQNYNPHSKWLALFVHARRRENGATGANLIRSFGKTTYDFNNDSLIFTKAE